MIKEITASGKDVEEAKECACLLLGAVDPASVRFEVIDGGSRGILGIVNVRPAKVRASIEVPGEEPKKETRAPRAEVAKGEKSAAPASESARGESHRSHGGRKNNRHRERTVIPEMPDTPAEPHEAMIPESELKMEPIEIRDGEDASVDFVKKLIRNIGLEADVSLFACEDGTRRIQITGKDASAFIGHHGDTLDALQYLANLAGIRSAKGGSEDKKPRVTVDAEGYRAKREETLRALARRMAEKAKRNQRSVMLEPMTPYERRIIHSEVQNIDGVSTNSVGSDSNRKVVIYLVKKPAATDEISSETAESEENA